MLAPLPQTADSVDAVCCSGGMQPDAARLGETASPTNYTIPGAKPGTEKQYWYRDR